MKDGLGDTSSSSPYGTRSRNRTGNARPNYAEDKDVDLDYEYLPPKKENELKKSTRQNNASPAAPVEALRPGGSSRKSGVDEGKPAPSPTNGTKEQISPPEATPNHGTNGVGATQSSKKRKSTAQSSQSTPSSSVAAPPAATTSAPVKRLTSQSTSHNSGTGFSDTNMLTFSNCNATPVDGKLLADDGTVLAPNGRLPATPGRTPLPPPQVFSQTGDQSTPPPTLLRFSLPPSLPSARPNPARTSKPCTVFANTH